MTPPMTNDLIAQLLSDAESFTGDFNSVALPGPLANKRADRLRQAAAHIEAQAERVRELEGALDVADDALRSYACCGLGNACIRSPDQCRADCGQPAGLALDAIASARQARKDKEND